MSSISRREELPRSAGSRPSSRQNTLVHRKIVDMGLGYVGLPLAVALAETIIGFDIFTARVEELSLGLDRNGEFFAAELSNANLHFPDKEATWPKSACRPKTAPSRYQEEIARCLTGSLRVAETDTGSFWQL